MKKRIVLSLTPLALLMLLALPLAAQAQQTPRNPGELLSNPRALARYLRLTPEQTATYRQLRQQLQTAVQPLQETQGGLREQLRDGLEADAQDACAIGALAVSLHSNEEQIREARQTFDEAFSAILAPDQLTKYEALKEAVRHLLGRADS